MRTSREYRATSAHARSAASLFFFGLSSALVQQRLEVSACGLCLALRGLGGLAEAEITVNESGAMMIFRRDAGGLQRLRVGLAFVAQGIEPCRGDDRGREACKTFREQRRDTPVGAVRGIGEIMPAKP